MTLPTPPLDDRTWDQLVREAVALVERRGGPWRADSVHDPGVTLIEAFAHLTDILLYRLNRVPEKLHVTFLNVLGASLRPPVAASVVLRFDRRAAGTGPVAIPRGTRVTTAGAGEPPVFSTLADAVVGADADHVLVRAVHGRLIDGELVGVASGRPGLELVVPGAPLALAPAGAGLEVAVERPDAEGATRLVDGRAFERWSEVDGFSGTDPGEPVFVVDRSTGRVSFAPAADRPEGSALAAVPPAGAEVRAWWCDGGGDAGNVGAGTLTVLKDQVPGLAVTNPEAAAGGRDGEAVGDAVARAGHVLQSRGRAVTARDYEELAVGAAGAVSRARAFTRRDVWSFAAPGEVEVVLVPHVPPSERPGGRVGLEALVARQTEDARTRVRAVLEERQPLGADCVVRWCNLKVVSISAEVALQPGADRATVEAEVRRRVEDLLSPLPSDLHPRGRPFGEDLRASKVYRALEVPGVHHVEGLVFHLDEVPEGVVARVARDRFQPDTFFAASGGVLHRTVNATGGWEPAGRFPGGEIVAVAHPALGPGRSGLRDRPGHLAVVTTSEGASQIHVTRDLGERWERIAELGFTATGVAWAERGDRPLLLVSSGSGLHELAPEAGAAPVQSLVVADAPDLGLRAVEAFGMVRGELAVAVVGDAGRGVHLSTEGGRSGTFRDLGVTDDVRALAVQHDGPTTWLWIGLAAPDEPERGGCARIRLDDLSSGWQRFAAGWNGGTARALAVVGDTAYAATQSGGVLRLALGGEPRWRPVEVRSGIPLRDRARFTPVRDVAVDERSGLIVAATEQGVWRSTDGGDTYQPAAQREVTDHVALPATWLFCSGRHDLRVGGDHAG